MSITKKLFKHSFLGIYAAKILKGCLFLFTILVSVSDAEMTTIHIITYISIAFTAMIVIDIYCQYIGDQIRQRRPLSIDEVWNLIGEILPECVPGIFGILIFLFPLFGVFSQDLAFGVMETGCILLMVLFCYASQRLVGRKGFLALWPTFLAALLGAVFVFLRGRLS
jgi:hypothetical protein